MKNNSSKNKVTIGKIDTHSDTESSKAKLTVYKKFQELVFPLSDEELRLLNESILRYGVLDPIVVWQDGRFSYILTIYGSNAAHYFLVVGGGVYARFVQRNKNRQSIDI